MIRYYEKIKNKITTNRTIVNNTLSLSSLQVLNFIFPLITFPYLVHVIGVEKYGLIALATTLIMWLQVITRYGFDLYGVHIVSINRDNKDKLIEIFSSIFFVKLVLAIIAFLFLNIIIFGIEKFSNDWLIYYISFILLVGDIFFPTWFFQGMEDMKWITYINIGLRMFFTILIFVFVHDTHDYLMVPILNSIGMILAGIISLFIIYKKFGVYIKFPSLKMLRHQFEDGWYIFTSTLAVSMYTHVNTILLGYFTNYTEVGYFEIANRISKIVVTFVNAFTQAIYPNWASLYNISPKYFYKKFKKVIIYFFPIALSITIISIILVYFTLPFLVKTNYENIFSIYSILSFTIILIPYGVFFTQHLVITKNNKVLNKIVLMTAIVNFIFTPIGIYFWDALGLAYSIVLVQIFALLINYKYYNHIRNKNA